MNEEIKKNKPGPKPKAKLGESEQTTSPKPRQRVAMQAGTTLPTPDWAKDPDFKFRWCADYGKGKIERYRLALWESILIKDNHLKATDTSFVNINNIYPPTLRLGIPTIQAKEVGGKQSGFITTSPGPDFHNNVSLIVIIPGQEGKFQLLKPIVQLRLKACYLLLD